MSKLIERLQPLGRALMLPIAVLPIAGMLLRLGQADMLDIAFVSAAGDAIFSHLGLLFAVGVATGFARDGNGAACLAGLVCYLVTEHSAEVFIAVPPDSLAGYSGAGIAVASAAFRDAAIAKVDVPIGILSGLIGGLFYNRFSGIALPEYLAFFGGRRFVPIVSGLAGLVLAAAIGLGYGAINDGIDAASRSIVGAGSLGLFVYGVLNRLLLVTGLHHILNNVAWFVIGDYHGTTGDLRRFFAGDPTAGAFMTGFFPIMMFGLPAACLAMYHEALPGRRKAVAGMLLSLALTAFLTGVTEPIEFTFMFLAPALYGIHAALTGVSMAMMPALGVHLGFGFSAGLFDYVLNFGKSTRPLLLLPVGLVYAGVYYGLFRVVIRRFDLKTPGREPNGEIEQDNAAAAVGGRGAAFVVALGGSANLTKVEACTTRLRLLVEDQEAIDDAALKKLGAHGIIRPSAHAAQIVLGPVADMVAVEIRDALQRGPEPLSARPASITSPASVRQRVAVPAALAQALGGEENVRYAQALHGRLRVELDDPHVVDEAALMRAGARSYIQLPGGIGHILLDQQAIAAMPPLAA